MTKEQFLKELSRLLQDIPGEEREEALQYYESYLEDAGPEAEEEILKKLGSPEKVAALLKEGIKGEEKGEFTERGYETAGEKEQGYEVIEGQKKEGQSGEKCFTGRNQTSGGKTKRPKNGWRTAFWVLLAIFTCPVWLSILAVGFGFFLFLLLGGGGVLLGILLCIGVVTGALLICGLGILGSGFACLITSPLSGFLLCSCGLLFTGLGLLALCPAILFVWKVIPFCVRCFVNLCSLPFQRRRASA